MWWSRSRAPAMTSSFAHLFVASPTDSLLTSLCPFPRPSSSNVRILDINRCLPRLSSLRNGATLDDKGQISTSAQVLPLEQTQYSKEVEESASVLKNAAKTRKVPPQEILRAFSVIEKAKLDTSGSLETLGGTKSPGRTWMLIFTAEKKLERGRYFPVTAVQRFDAAGKRIENGVYLGPLGYLTFEGRFAWKKRVLQFIFDQIQIKLGPFNPLKFSFNSKDDREPGRKDPCFIWFYIDEEIAVARGRSGGTAYWVRCRRIGH